MVSSAAAYFFNEAVARYKFAAAAVMNYETPLTALVGLADTVQLTRPPPSDEQRELIERRLQKEVEFANWVHSCEKQLEILRMEHENLQLEQRKLLGDQREPL